MVDKTKLNLYGPRIDVDLVPFDQFIIHFESSSVWPTNLKGKDSAFKRLLKIDGLFLTDNN